MSKQKRSKTEAQKQQQLLQKIHVDIPVDYELLAKEILKQQELLENAKKTAAAKKEEPPQKRIGFWKSLWSVLTHKRDTEGRLLAGSMATILMVAFYCVGVMLFLLTAAFVAFPFIIAFSMEWSSLSLVADHISYFLISFALGFTSFVFGVLMFGAGHEMDQENDRNYIADVFSGITGFVALIIAVIALYKQLYP